MATKQGLGNTGSVLSGLTIVMGGKNTFGKTGDVKLPEWEFEVVDEESTGIPKSAKISIQVHDMSGSYLSAMMAGESFIIKGNIRENGVDVPYSATMNCQLHKVGTDTKEGEYISRTLEGRIDNFEEVVSGSQTVKYSREKLELILGGNGVNLLEKFAKNVL